MYTWDFMLLWKYRELFVVGLGYTMYYTVLCVIFGMLIGLLVALTRLAAPRIINMPLQLFVELFRCTPFLVLLIWFYYAFPVLIGVDMSASLAALLALSLYGGAFYSEIIRAGIVSIDAGQREAAQALGMTKGQGLRRIVLPQALKRMVPPLMNQSILQLKNTSLVSVLAVPDLLYQGQLVAHETYRPLEIYTVVALLYFAVLFPATILVRNYERRLAASD
ncbi:MAG: amino acid ABC transporter permease [Burkholderiaceae bacterium]|nr:amino acid ABC transporter permease [Burkholderiaceae bacterium]